MKEQGKPYQHMHGMGYNYEVAYKEIAALRIQ